MPIPDSPPLVIAPMVTPFRQPDEPVDHDAIARNVERYLDTPLSGLSLGSGTGEETSLSDTEKLEIVKTVHAALGGEMFIQAGIDTPSVARTLYEVERYVAAGADSIRLRVPRGLLPEAFTAYFEEAVPRIPVPVLVINQTMGAPPAAPPERIAAVTQIDNVDFYVMSGDFKMESVIIPEVPKGKHILAANGRVIMPSIAVGANGAHMLFGGMSPELCMEIITRCLDDRFAEAKEFQDRLAIAEGPAMRYGMAGVKYGHDLMRYEAGTPRRASAALGDAEKAEISAGFRAAGLID